MAAGRTTCGLHSSSGGSASAAAAYSVNRVCLLLFSSRQAGPLHRAVRQVVRARRSDQCYPSKARGWGTQAPCCKVEGGGLRSYPL